jgi:hypothetical protein
MSEEDDLSRLAEEQHKDELERRRWREREAAELAAWELQQRARDEEEARSRLARAADLEVRYVHIYMRPCKEFPHIIFIPLAVDILVD